ncbi:MAG: ABC transporter ATP-binding protein [Mesorhizobium sp. 61-13]|nr:MAG: ABC transporter ATP-binding protein [Mesorhizobium sp. 61-13]
MPTTEHLRVERLTKRFGEVTAVDSASFDVRRGEVHCLLGENGAGKSTLSECLYGFYRPDSGRLFVDGHPVAFSSPRDAIAHGIGMVHQHFVLVTPLSVIENVVLGTHKSGWSANLTEARQRLAEICDRYGIQTDFNAKIWQLSVGEQQWVEILKALYIGAELLILDEPTAVLTPQESERLFRIIRRMTDDGLSVILISHKLNEVMQSDRVTVLRKGKIVGTVNTEETTKSDLVKMMVGRSVSLKAERRELSAGKPVLEVKDLAVNNDRGLRAVNGLTFQIRANEILGIAGVAGNGQKELFEALVGARKVEQGSVHLNGANVTNLSPKSMIDIGIGYIPDDRYRAGLVGEFDIEENLILGLQERAEFSRHKLLDVKRMAKFAQEAINQFGIVTPSSKARANTLSGGNAQKIILARELWSSKSCLLANQPTRGLDVGVIEYVHKMLLEKRSDGFAVLLASEELDDILALSDRIAVIVKGEFMGIFDAGSVSLADLGLLMAGQKLGTSVALEVE